MRSTLLAIAMVGLVGCVGGIESGNGGGGDPLETPDGDGNDNGDNPSGADLSQAKQLFDAYKIDGVPTLGIHGRWFTSGSLAGGHERALQVADQLIARARKPS